MIYIVLKLFGMLVIAKICHCQISQNELIILEHNRYLSSTNVEKWTPFNHSKKPNVLSCEMSQTVDFSIFINTQA